MAQLGTGQRGPTDIRTVPDALLWTDAWVNMYWSISYYARCLGKRKPGFVVHVCIFYFPLSLMHANFFTLHQQSPPQSLSISICCWTFMRSQSVNWRVPSSSANAMTYTLTPHSHLHLLWAPVNLLSANKILFKPCRALCRVSLKLKMRIPLALLLYSIHPVTQFSLLPQITVSEIALLFALHHYLAYFFTQLP